MWRSRQPFASVIEPHSVAPSESPAVCPDVGATDPLAPIPLSPEGHAPHPSDTPAPHPHDGAFPTVPNTAPTLPVQRRRALSPGVHRLTGGATPLRQPKQAMARVAGRGEPLHIVSPPAWPTKNPAINL